MPAGEERGEVSLDHMDTEDSPSTGASQAFWQSEGCLGDTHVLRWLSCNSFPRLSTWAACCVSEALWSGGVGWGEDFQKAQNVAMRVACFLSPVH